MARESLKERVYEGVYENVINGLYQQNDVLTEKQLIETYGVSKSPVREALIELCKDGILKNIPRTGYQVVPVTLKEVIDSLELRVDIETAGLKKAMSFLTEEQLEKLREIALRHQEQRDRVVSQNWSRNYEFHTYLYSLNGNTYAYGVLTQLIRQSSRYISQYFQYAWRKKSESNGRYHIAIVEALGERNTERACEMLERDILAVKHEVLSIHSHSIS